MRKTITILSFSFMLLLGTFGAKAQAQYQEADVVINAGLGLGYYYAGGTPLVVSGEYFVNDKISVGPYLGYTRWTRKIFGERFKYTFLDIGARGSYHFNEVLNVTNEKVDLYGGLSLGVLIASYKGPDTFGTYNDPYDGGLRLGLHAGARYYFAEQVAVFGELGVGFAPLTIGLTFKL